MYSNGHNVEKMFIQSQSREVLHTAVYSTDWS